MAYRDENVLVARAAGSSRIDIPDAGGDEVGGVLRVQDEGQARRIVVEIELTHASVSDLVVSLSAPSGSRVLLYNQHRADGTSHTLRFDSDDFERLQPLLGERTTGGWRISVKDTVGADTGTLDRWSLTVEIAQPRP